MLTYQPTLKLCIAVLFPYVVASKVNDYSVSTSLLFFMVNPSSVPFTAVFMMMLLA